MPPFNFKQSQEVGAIKVSPTVVPATYFKQIDARLRQMIVDTGVAEIRRIIQTGIFKHPTGALANSIRGKVEGAKGLVWWSDLPHAAAQEHGVRPHAMWYLLNKTIPITVYGMGGSKTVFRKATLKSFMMGKWFHRGYPGKGYMRKGIEQTVAKIPQLLQKAQEEVMRGLK